jgi:hypothetical protein
MDENCEVERSISFHACSGRIGTRSSLTVTASSFVGSGKHSFFGVLYSRKYSSTGTNIGSLHFGSSAKLTNSRRALGYSYVFRFDAAHFADCVNVRNDPSRRSRNDYK